MATGAETVQSAKSYRDLLVWQEGMGKEFARFLRIAMGSVAELETPLELSTRLDLLSPDESDHVLRGCGEIAKMAQAIIRSVLSHSLLATFYFHLH